MKGTLIYRDLMQDAAILLGLMTIVSLLGWSAWPLGILTAVQQTWRVCYIGQAMFRIVEMRKDPIVNYLYLVRTQLLDEKPKRERVSRRDLTFYGVGNGLTLALMLGIGKTTGWPEHPALQFVLGLALGVAAWTVAWRLADRIPRRQEAT